MLKKSHKKSFHPGEPILPMVINKDGTLNVHRPKEPGKIFFDLYHAFLSISWPEFFTFLVLFFLVNDLVFASLYYLAGPQSLEGAHPTASWDRFLDCFIFSVHLLTSPFEPVGAWINFLVIFQTYWGTLTLVIVTGLLYARFARPSARVIFSDKAIIGQYNGRPCLSFRVANERLNQIVEARMALTLTRNETSQEGETSRKLHHLKLENDYSSLFALSWTIRHFIDETSPLFSVSQEQLTTSQAAILASLSGIDDTFSQTITARTVFRYDEILYNKRFKDILVWKGNKMHINLKGIHDVVEGNSVPT